MEKKNSTRTGDGAGRVVSTTRELEALVIDESVDPPVEALGADTSTGRWVEHSTVCVCVLGSKQSEQQKAQAHEPRGLS